MILQFRNKVFLPQMNLTVYPRSLLSPKAGLMASNTHSKGQFPIILSVL